jgi:hypothetical protein
MCDAVALVDIDFARQQDSGRVLADICLYDLSDMKLNIIRQEITSQSSETSKAGSDVMIFSTWFPRAQRSVSILASRKGGGSLDRIMSQSHET